MPTIHHPSPLAQHRHNERGSLIITAMLIAAVIGVGLTSYIALSKNSMRMAQRTFYANDALNLAEAGLEEALYSYNQMNSGVATATAWANWTISGANAQRTMTFNRDQNALGTVKIYVKGYDGSNEDPYIIVQSTVTPFDGGRTTTRILQINLEKNAYFNTGVVGINGIQLGQSYATTISANSYNSGKTKAFTQSTQLTGNTSVGIKTGNLTVSSGSTMDIGGDLYLGTGLTKPSNVTVSGSQYSDYAGVFPLPTYPTNTTVVATKRKRGKRWGNWNSWGKNWGNSVTLPLSGATAAADGKYYYSADNVTISNLTVQANKDVVIVGTGSTNIDIGNKDKIAVNSGATLTVYMTGPISIVDDGQLTSSWAGALQVFTSTTSTCNLAAKSTFYACIYAPNANLYFNGNNNSEKNFDKNAGQNDGRTVVGSFVGKTITSRYNARLIYDEALTTLNAGRVWNMSAWWEMSDSTDRSLLGTMTNNFIQ